MGVRCHGFGPYFFGQLCLERHELGGRLDRVMPGVREWDGQFRLDPAWPCAKYHHAIGHENRFVDVVRDKQHVFLCRLSVAQQKLLQLLTCLVVQGAIWLVEQQNLGFVGQRPCNGCALLHAP